MVGIDAVSVYVPRPYLEIDLDWAMCRSEDPEKLVSKIRNGIGIEKIAIPDTYEDTITMAAMAVTKLIKEQNIDINQIGYIAFATETGIDHSKSCASYLLGVLERYFDQDISEIGGVDFQFACISSSYALETLLALIESKRLNKPYAILVTSDIAKYPLLSTGEYTQGAGATALLIKENPRLIAFSNSPFTTLLKDEHDFFRPLGRSFPIVDGKYSVGIYSSLIQRAFEIFKKQNNIEIDRYLFHLPFPTMAKQALFFMLYQTYFSKSLSNLTKEEVRIEKNKFLQLPVVKDIIKEKINSSLGFTKIVGNIYTGSIFLALSSLMECDSNLENKKILFCAYGSGASSKMYAGVIQPDYKKVTTSTAKMLENRTKLSLAEYQKLHRGRSKIPVIKTSGIFQLEKIDLDGLRHYKYLE